MTGIKALDKLRAYEDVDRFESMEPWDVAHIADEIEAEVADNYMRLPVDRKNEPWHIGDKFSFTDAGGNKRICTVSGISVSEVFFYYDEHHDSTKHRHFKADVLAHVKPRTLEDVLCGMIHEYGSTDSLTEAIAEKYADIIRELNGL